MRICRKCKTERPLQQFKKIQKKYRRRVCNPCQRRNPKRKEDDRRYNESEKGVARKLRDHHGYSRSYSIRLARDILNPYTKCCVCGVPSRWLFAKKRDGCRSRHFNRLTADHIQPGGASIPSNTRILCGLCNRLRGAAERTDEQVLILTRRWYEKRGFDAKDLWWLHISPGKGGLDRLGSERLHRHGRN